MGVDRTQAPRRLTDTVQRVVDVGANAKIGAGPGYWEDTWNATKTLGAGAAAVGEFGYNKIGAVGDELISLFDGGNEGGVPLLSSDSRFQQGGIDTLTRQPLHYDDPSLRNPRLAGTRIDPRIQPRVEEDASPAGSSTAAWAQQFDAPQRVPSMTDPKAASDDMLTRAKGAQDRALEYASMIGNYNSQIDELNRQQLAAIQAGATEVAARYDEQINDLRGRVEQAKIAMSRSMEAFQAYSEQVGPAYVAAVDAAVAGQAAQDEAMAGRVGNVEAAISGEFDATVENLEETADLIGTGSVRLSDSLEGAMDVFEGMMKDAARGRIEDVDRISDAAALFATAQSKAVKADDEFMTEIERETLEIQIQSQLDQMADQIGKLETDKKNAVDAAMAQYDPLEGFGSAEEAWEWAFGQLAFDQGWGVDEEALIRSYMGKMGGVKNRAEAIEWLNDSGEFISAHYSVLEDYLDQHYEGRDIPEFWLPHMQAIAEGGPMADDAIEIIRNSIQDPNFTTEMIEGMFATAEADYDNLLDAFDLYESNTKTWDASREALAGSGGGREAVANYNNRNQPAYVQRREVGVPTFVKSFQAAFGKTGTGREYVGGVTSSLTGALRSPELTGNGRSSNSDHLSGGAVDLYGATTAELESIERWANSQPGVSFVVYSGNSSHQTGLAGGANSGVAGRGHVHVSLQVGYW